jgi:hypothetical protein
MGIPTFLWGDNPSKRTQGITFLMFALGLAITYPLGQKIPVFNTFALAFPGFPAGTLAYCSLVLAKRYMIPGHVAPYPSSDLRGNQSMRNSLLVFSFLYLALFLFVVGFAISSDLVLYTGAVILVVLGFVVLPWLSIKMQRNSTRKEERAEDHQEELSPLAPRRH